MKNIRHLLYSLFVVALTLSCTPDRIPTGAQLADVPCVLKPDRSEIPFSAQGEAVQLAIKSQNVSWELTGAPSWLTLSQKSGTGDATVTLTATENKDVDNSRVAVLQLKSTTAKYEFSKSVTVTQSAASIYLTTSETSLTLAPQAVQKNITISSDVEWEAVSSAGWLELTKTNATTLSLNASENTTAGTRTATVTLRRVGTTRALATISVVQSEAGITGSTDTVAFTADGGTKSVDIEADVTWSATTSEASWLTVTPTSGTGGKVSLGISALANNSAAARSAYVYVKIGTEQKLAIPVSQEGISFNVVGALENVFAADGSTKQKLTVESNTAWAVLSCPEWLTVTPAQGSKGTCEITLQAAANNSLDSRSATLRIGIEGLTIYKDITVAQEGVTIELGDRSLDFGWETAEREVEITFPGSWSAMASDDWLTLSQSSGLGEETIIVTAATNPGEDVRTGTITVASEGRSMKITAVQQGQYLKINSTAGEVGAMGGSVNLTVTTTVGAAASVEYQGTAKDWVTYDNDDKGNYTLSVAYNPSSNNRTAQFVIKPTMSGTNTTCSSGVKFAITQKGRSLSANVSKIVFSVAGGTSDTYTITADGGYSITKPDADDWYTLQQDSASCTFSIVATENTTNNVRTSRLTVSLAGLPSGETKDLVIEVLQYDLYNGYEYVDLGLPSGIKWAAYNVGATKPEEYGGYYAWGETEEKENYDWSTYRWCNGSYNTMTKYCINSSYGTVDNKTTLDLEDDVAHVEWGGSWRMPTKAEQDELRNNCTWTWTTQNGVNGYKVTSKTNGNSIFLPAAGYRSGVTLYAKNSEGHCWSNLLYTKDDIFGYYANSFRFFSGISYACYNLNRDYGLSVRPVCGEWLKYTVSVGTAGSGAVAIKDVDGTSATIEVGSTVTVVATPDEGYLFDGWFIDGNETPVSTDAEYTFTVSEDVALTAKFTKCPVVTISSGGNGSVSFADSSNGSIFVQPGAEVTVVATPDEGYLFDGWFINGNETPVSTAAEYTFTVSEDVALVAKFEQIVYEAVDLGLLSGIKWATCNVGATRPEEYGGYYAWGETEEKENYDWSTYKWCNGRPSTMTKYCTNSSYGTVDNKTTLDLEDDVANVKWGGTWRMPTKAELNELRNNCTWEWTTQNNVNGHKVTSKTNGNSIFLPAAGYRYGTNHDYSGRYGFYWSSSSDESSSNDAYYSYFANGGYFWSYSNRCDARSVRPVCGEPAAPVEKCTVTVNCAGNGNVVIKDKDDTAAEIETCSTVTVVATPDEGYLFDGWFIDGNEIPVSTAAEYTFTVICDVALTAKFVPIVCEAVDLGLPSGLKWATCNVGATKPEEYGGYYAWGETEEKENYDESTYKWCNGSYNTMTKYCIDDGLTVLDPEDDVAHVKWGGSWRMPTRAEQDELCKNCTWTWTTQNGVDGYKVTGPNGNSIFLPAAGGRYGTRLDSSGSYGFCWSSSFSGSDSNYADRLYFYSGNYDCDINPRCFGFSVRPVCVEKYTVSVGTAGSGAVAIKDVDGTSAAIEVGSTLTVVATPADGYLFDGWFIDGNEIPVSTAAEYTFTVICDVALTAKFVPIVCEAVDLGLPSGLKWATCNVGATKPEEYGGYYAWGETEEKENYDESTYKWCNGSYNTMTKYCIDDGLTVLDPEDDVAHVKWGGDWRMPTKVELNELRNNCTWTWTTQNNVNGYKVTGPNGNSIFLPAAGYRDGTGLLERGSYGYYWSGSLFESYSHSAYCLCFYYSGYYDNGGCSRSCGLAVRPVCGEKYTVSVGTAGSGAVAIKDVDGTSATIEWGSTVTVVATPDEGYAFDGWYVDGDETPVSTAAEYTFTVSEDVALQAKFVPIVYEAVDLGLPSGIKWATCNVGATKPERYGGYYAWGETEEKENYDWSTYKWCNGSKNTMTKYCTDSYYGTVDNKTELDPEDDVAHVKWGGDWRMPTKAELNELLTNCTWTWTTQNGVNGYMVTGPNGNSIFLPAAGTRYGTNLGSSDGGCYWSSSLNEGNSYGAFHFHFSSGHFTSGYSGRHYGWPVRPVYGEKYTVSVGTAGCGAVAIKDVDGTSATVGVGSTLTVVATPDEGYVFDGWYVDGNETRVSTAAEYTFTVNEDIALVARFKIVDYNGHEYVDLGLPSGLKWATCNVGASSPEEYGGYYAWGETEEKENYDWSTYKWCNGSENTLTKYCTDSDYGTVDNKTVLDPEDDVAHVKWGGSWRMPTEADFYELLFTGTCTWTWTTQNGVNGYKVTSKTNGNSIFIPAAGNRYGTDLRDSGSLGNYWSSSLVASSCCYALDLGFRCDNYYWYGGSRYYGYSVRPVSK